MKLLKLSCITLLALVLAACPSNVVTVARDTAAALQGAIIAAQSANQASCTATPTGANCVLINKAISAENALITATEAYCGWSATAPPTNPQATCTPVSTLSGALNAAITNATTFITELKGAI